MPATKLTVLINAGTLDSSGNVARVAGGSESYYNIALPSDPSIPTKVNQLLVARAALMPANTKIVGYRLQQVDPNGPTKGFDTVFPGGVAQNDLPQVAFQWTVRSANTPNQMQRILRFMPDARIVTGEFSPGSSAFNAALQAFFSTLTANWVFRAIDRTQPIGQIQDITGLGIMTTVQPHGLVTGDLVNIMSTKIGGEIITSYRAKVTSFPTPTTVGIARLGKVPNVSSSGGGRFRKANIIYCPMEITGAEVGTPTAITRKAGGPNRKFRGRRATKRR